MEAAHTLSQVPKIRRRRPKKPKPTSYWRKLYAKNGPLFRRRVKDYYARNRELCKRRAMEYHWKHRRRILLRNRLWWKKNKEEQQRKRRRYHKLNREAILARGKRNNREIKQAVLEKYGKVCRCCGESRFEFLTLEHPRGNGRAHRKRLGSSGNGGNFYWWLKKHHFPPGYEILCWNCNCAKGKYGKCPHEVERLDKEEKDDARNTA